MGGAPFDSPVYAAPIFALRGVSTGVMVSWAPACAPGMGMPTLVHAPSRDGARPHTHTRTHNAIRTLAEPLPLVSEATVSTAASVAGNGWSCGPFAPPQVFGLAGYLRVVTLFLSSYGGTVYLTDTCALRTISLRGDLHRIRSAKNKLRRLGIHCSAGRHFSPILGGLRHLWPALPVSIRSVSKINEHSAHCRESSW